MKFLKCIFVCLAASLVLAGGWNGFGQDGSKAQDEDVVLGAIGLLPDGAGDFGGLDPEFLEKQQGFTLSEEEMALLETPYEGKWRTYSDDLIEFEVPDHPLLKVEALTPKASPKLRVVGGAVTTADNSFQKVYRLTFGEERPYGLILVRDESWFDEGICLCGPIAMKTFVPVEGNLLELSQLPNGDIKKVQVINDTHRAILFEWTHSVIRQDAYARIGSSLRLKPASNRSEEEWRALTKEKRPSMSEMGWLRPEMSESDLIDLLGEGAKKKGDTVLFIRDNHWEDGSGWKTKMSFPVREGKLDQLDVGWHETEELPPLEGSVAWAEEMVEEWENMPEEKGKREAKGGELIEIFLEMTAEDQNWNRWCGVVYRLSELGLKDARVVDVVVKGLENQKAFQDYAMCVVQEYDLPNREELMRDRMEYLLRYGNAGEVSYSALGNLYRWTRAGDTSLIPLVREGLAHSSPDVRGDAVNGLGSLPSEEQKPALWKLLKDDSPEVRRSAVWEIDKIFSKDDLPRLQEMVDAETEDWTKKQFQNAIDRIEGK